MTSLAAHLHSAVIQVNAVREALDQTIGPGARLRALPCPSNIAEQPIGLEAGRQGCYNRLEGLALAVPPETEVTYTPHV